MPALWETVPDDIKRLQGDSPRFTAFLNALLRSAARLGGLSDCDVSTTVRDNRSDGGVDGAIDKAQPQSRWKSVHYTLNGALGPDEREFE